MPTPAEPGILGAMWSVKLTDSEALAQQNRAELDLDSREILSLVRTTQADLERGSYTAPSGRQVSLAGLLDASMTSIRSLRESDALPARSTSARTTKVEIANMTTTTAAKSLVSTGLKTLALNFANGTTPGGGYLHGARAQEESLCRMSALYPTIEHDPMYAYHRASDPIASSGWAILSGQVPFFRELRGQYLEEPWLLDVLTCAAPIATRMSRTQSRERLRSRIHRVLEIATAFDYEAVVLGAWGCGAFGNDPRSTALDFHAELTGPFSDAFRHVCFAITDWSPERRFLGPFRDVFQAREEGV